MVRGLGGKHNNLLPPPASLNLSWPRLKRSPHAFAVIRADQAVAVFVGIHLSDGFACLVVDLDETAVTL
jgi:hypothetical protein